MTRKIQQPRSSACYDSPAWWDMAFRSETREEAAFLEAAAKKYGTFPVRRMLEPGCGGGRLVVEMASRDYDVVAYDNNAQCVRYVKQRLRRRNLTASVFEADMQSAVVRPKVDLAFCTVNTFRHMNTEAAAVAHLDCVAQSLRRGGLYILAFHLLPPDADEEDSERWTSRHGRTQVTTTLRVLNCSRRKQQETIRFCLHVRNGTKIVRLQSDYVLRIYTAAQVRHLFAAVPAFQLLDVFDFWYDIDQPLELNDELGDAVFVLRRT